MPFPFIFIIKNQYSLFCGQNPKTTIKKPKKLKLRDESNTKYLQADMFCSWLYSPCFVAASHAIKILTETIDRSCEFRA